MLLLQKITQAIRGLRYTSRPLGPLPAPVSVGLFLITISLTITGCTSKREGSEQTSVDGRDVAKSNRSVSQGNIRFREVAQSGINASYQNGHEANNYSIVESLGGGIGLGDFDGDHDLDVFVPSGGHFPGQSNIAGHASRLFFNDGEFQFRDVTSRAGVDVPMQYSHGANVGDFDNDGFLDVIVTGYARLALWHNMGDGTFVELSMPSGLTDTLWSSSSAWGDFDGDGGLDLYVAHYANWSWSNHPLCPGPEPGQKEVCPPRRFEPLPDTLYLSDGDGHFSDGSQTFGLRRDGKGLGVVVADVDLDGDSDLYVGNDTVANFLYLNQGNAFDDAGLKSGTAFSDRGTPDGSMGVDIGDLTGDGLPDIWVANYESESIALYRNQGQGFFQHVSQQMGVTGVGALYVGWGALLVDLDHDGDLDAFVSNGHVVRHPVNAPLKQKPLVFENVDSKRLVDVAASAGEYTAGAHEGRGCAAGDLDGDGDLDLVISRLNAPVAVLANDTESRGSVLSVRLIGTISNRDAIGAIVRVGLSNGNELIGQVKSGSSFASTSERDVVFGIPTGLSANRVSVQWPSGKKSQLDDGSFGRTVTVIEPVDAAGRTIQTP